MEGRSVVFCSLFLAKYPQLKQFFGVDPWFKWHVSLWVVLQIGACMIIGGFDDVITWPWIVIAAYWFGGTINHSLTLAIHDISHNTAFGQRRWLANRLFGMWANLPLGAPMSISFKRYHIEHHRYLAVDGVDPDLPTSWEANFFSNTLLKVIWMLMQPFFYTIRPLFVRPKKPGYLEFLNLTFQFIFDAVIWYFCGVRAILYLVLSTVLSMGLHPMAGHFLSEHYMILFGYDTYSYYGPMNAITFNVGYHVEHHDLPYVPSCSLPDVKAIAPEFYRSIPHHTSWTKVLWRFITEPTIGPFARLKRPTRKDAHHQ